jgi:hypothetical protein
LVCSYSRWEMLPRIIHYIGTYVIHTSRVPTRRSDIQGAFKIGK